MAALANILSVPPIAIPLGNQSSIHFTQLPLLITGMFAGPAAGLLAGAIGGLSMSFIFVPRIPLIVGGLAILGCAAGLFAKRLRPLFSGILAWLVQAPYVAVTDYFWFTLLAPEPARRTPEAAWAFVMTILVILTIEAVISSALAEVVIAYIKRAGITL